MMKHLNTLSICTTLLLMSYASASLAESKLTTKNPHYGEKGWEVEIVAGVGTFSDYIYKTNKDDKQYSFAGVNATYYGEQFYFTANEIDGLMLGFNLDTQVDQAWDVILAPRFSGFDSNSLLKDLDERDTDLHTGLRYTHYYSDSLYEIELTTDISGEHGGSIFSAMYEKEWQQKNWIITGSIAAVYLSQKMTDYYFGVDASEATADFAAYNVSASAYIATRLRVEYPLSENWVFSATATHLFSDGEISDSPITLEKDQVGSVQTSIKYHF